jgi:hypothetical protein
MTGTNCDLFTHKSSRSYLNHLVYPRSEIDGKAWIGLMWFRKDVDSGLL